jgi:hypothetical protein
LHLQKLTQDIYGTKCIFFCYAILVGLNVLVIQLFIHDSDEGPVTKGPQAGAEPWELSCKILRESGERVGCTWAILSECLSKICIRSQSELVQYFAGILEAMVANAVEI